MSFSTTTDFFSNYGPLVATIQQCFHVITTCSVLSFCVAGSLSAQSSADWDWISNHFGKALDDVFPIDERYGVYVAYRSHRDLHIGVPEYSFVIGPKNSDTVSGLPRYLAAQVRDQARPRWTHTLISVPGRLKA